MEPSTLFFGLISGDSLCLPKRIPMNRAKVSLTDAMKKVSISASVEAVRVFRSWSVMISEKNSPG